MVHKTFFRQSLRLLLAVLMFVSVSPAAMAADDWSYPTSTPSQPFGGGDGTKEKPYRISTAQHLANLAYMVSKKGEDYEGKYFLQTNDIVLNDNVIGGATKEADGRIRYNKNKAHFDNLKRWQPIGMYGTVYDDDFEGIYDGGGHSISGIYCRKPMETSDKAYRYIGLFGSCDEARISNLTIKDSFYSICAPNNNASTLSLGLLVGHAEDVIVTNCHADNCVISSDGDAKSYLWNIGGLIGEIEETFTAKGCSYNGIVDVYQGKIDKNGEPDCNIGGLIGAEGHEDYLLKSISMEDCSTGGKLFFNDVGADFAYEEGLAHIGGIVGNFVKIKINDNKPNILRCTNRMEINVFDDSSAFPTYGKIRISGIFNSMHDATASECINFGNINFGGSTFRQRASYGTISVNGICDEAKIDNCFNYGDIMMAPMNTSKSMYIGSWLSWKGEASDCFAYNKIAYSFQNGTPGVYTTSGGDKDLDISDAKSYTTINGKAEGFGINEADFKSQNYVYQLNNAANAAKYGLIKEDGFAYDGYLSLTSLGALTNSLHGHGTEADPYTISNASDLRTLAYMISTGRDITGNLFKLTNNIDLTNEQEFDPIGTETYPFSGIFDGCGHYIRGMKAKYGYMFTRVTGTVRNLALDDFKSQNENVFAGIAYYVGSYGAAGGIIENCYVTGDADLKVTESFQPPTFGGICIYVDDNATVRNCYYTGNVQFGYTTQDQCMTAPYIGGIVERANGTVENCYAAFNFQNSMSAKALKTTVGGIVSEGTPKLKNNYYCSNISYDEQEPKIQTYDGATAVDSESKIDAAKLGDAWKKGMRHPVLKAAYHYDCKDPDGNDAALDPTGYMPTDNSILTLVPTAEQTADTKMWQLSNVAVYSEDMGAEILTDFCIIPDTDSQHYPLRYTPTKEGVAVKGAVTYPWAIHTGLNWRSFCLPGSVSIDQLPEGCKMYIGGTLTNDGDETYKMNIVEVEKVPAGVPFFVRYDNPGEAETFYITMTGDLAMTPQKASEASSLSGTYAYLPGQGHNSIVEDESGKLTMPYNSSIFPNSFQAYVATDYAGFIDIADYMLLSEESNNTDETIEANNGNTVKLKMRRSFKKGGWNTVCLPFDISVGTFAKMLGEGTVVEEISTMSGSPKTDIVLTFRRMNSTPELASLTIMNAGTPYLVRPANDVDILDFGNVGIKNIQNPQTAEFTEENSVLSLIGSFGKTRLLSTDTENHYFIQDDKFYRAVGKPIISLGFRCYVKIASLDVTSAAPQLGSARIVHSDGTVTNVRLVDTGLGNGGERIYDIQGMQHSEMQRGLNIVGGKKIMK